MKTKQLILQKQEELEVLRTERRKHKDRFQAAAQGIKLAFDNSLDDQEISFQDLSLFVVGDRVVINEKVEFVKTSQCDNKMVFLTYLKEGGTFGFHKHNCIEICEVVEGILIEPERNYKCFTEGETIIYAKNEIHKPYATRKSIYKVTYVKKLNL